MNAYEQIYAIVRQIPKGKVATYGQIAALTNRLGQARLVGYALHRIAPHESDIPWYRVINAKGEISYSIFRQGGDYVQHNLLEEEGVVFSREGKIDLKEYQWHPEQ